MFPQGLFVMSTQILGDHLESQVKHRIKQVPRLTSWTKETTTEYLTQRAIRTKRLASVTKVCVKEWGSWAETPLSTLLDWYWGVDAPILYRGYTMAVDITIDPDKLSDKVTLLGYLFDKAHCPHPSGVDSAAVWYCTSCPPIEWITATLKAMTRQPTGSVQVYRYTAG